MKAYFGSRISQNQTMTPDGFLIAHNVPIARTGTQTYMGSEIGLDHNEPVEVYRSPDEVFSPAAMASFEGKPVTNNHPPEGVMPNNATTYIKGTTSNVRRGKGEDDDLLLADLIIYDEQLIHDIQNGKREVSAGYECDYTDNDDGTYSQSGIVGNHVAVVDSGRAGDRVRINDTKSVRKTMKDKKARETSMTKKLQVPRQKQSRVTNFLAAVGLKTLAMDAEPDEVMEAMDAYADERGKDEGNDFPVPTTQESASKDATPEDVQGIEALRQQVEALTALVQKALAPKAADEDPEKAIDAAIAQMEDPEETPGDEDSHTIEPTNDEEGPIADPEDRPKNGFTAKDSAAAVAFLKKMKPAIAAIKDPAEKKRVADAALAAVKGRPARPSNTYANLQNGARKKASDKQAEQKQVDQSELGRKWAKKFNPHYKNQA